jgi:hypothetical protein
MKLKPLILLEEFWHLRKLVDTICETYAETHQPLLCIPRGCHEGLSLEKMINRQLRIVTV